MSLPRGGSRTDAVCSTARAWLRTGCQATSGIDPLATRGIDPGVQAAATNQDENGAVGRLTEGGRSPTVVSLYPRRASFLMGRRGERLRCDSARNESYGASGQEDEPVGRPLVRFFGVGRYVDIPLLGASTSFASTAAAFCRRPLRRFSLRR